MSQRVPPRLALWLLERWGSRYHSESLAGDLIEQYQDGKSRAWCWTQVIVAIAIARAKFIRALPWMAAGKVLIRLIAETVAVLALATGAATWADSGHRASHCMPDHGPCSPR